MSSDVVHFIGKVRANVQWMGNAVDLFCWLLICSFLSMPLIKSNTNWDRVWDVLSFGWLVSSGNSYRKVHCRCVRLYEMLYLKIFFNNCLQEVWAMSVFVFLNLPASTLSKRCLFYVHLQICFSVCRYIELIFLVFSLRFWYVSSCDESVVITIIFIIIYSSPFHHY